MAWDVMKEHIEGIHIYKVDDTMDLSKYSYDKIIHGKVLYVYHIFEMDDWNRTRFIDTLEETPEGVWLVSIKPIDKLKEYEYKHKGK